MEKKEHTDSYSHILKYTGLFGGIQSLNILISLVRNKFVALILGPEGMGLISLFNSTIKLVSDSTNLGISMSGVREISETYEQGDTEKLAHIIQLIRFWSLITALAGMVICIVLSPLLNRWTFSWGDHTLHFMLLSPVVALTAVCGGELAILKGTRQLGRLAITSVYNVLAALLTSVPLYYEFGEAAIVPSLCIMALAQLIITICFSYKLYPLRLKGCKGMMREGMGMIKLGIAFVLAGVMGSGAEFVIRSFLNATGSLEAVGLYNSGYMMTMTYAGMVFSAMETDYFPRLSGISGVGPELNRMVNHQIEVSLLLVAPLLVFFMTFLPLLLPMLFSGRFMPIKGMMRITVLAMYFRAIALPIEYIPLSKGDSRSYLLLELVYDVMMAALVIAGYHIFQLAGTGIALTLASMANMVMVLAYTCYKYGFKLSSSVKLYALLQMPLGLTAYLSTQFTTGWVYWMIGVLMTLISLTASIQILHTKSHLWKAMRRRVANRLNRWRRNKEE
ncbi:MAG: oligosaccharide flippase family protein [Prevotella sp.]|nr:oligosaccharide flippase family protein [Prevotella sp.]